MTSFSWVLPGNWGFPCGSAGKESACNGGDLGSVSGLGRSPGEGKGYPLQYSRLENSMDRGPWRATVHGVAKSWILLSDWTELNWTAHLKFKVNNVDCWILEKVKMKVAQSCLTLCDPMDYRVHKILHVRILEWVAFPFSRGSSQPRDWTQVSCIAGGFFTSWATRESLLGT